MQCCTLSCMARQYAAQLHREEVSDHGPPPILFRFVERFARRLHWHGLLALLSAIPDSNDDFGIF